jgi:serine protease inhibitor
VPVWRLQAPPGESGNATFPFDLAGWASESRCENGWELIMRTRITFAGLGGTVCREAVASILMTLFSLPLLAAPSPEQAKLVSGDTGFAFSLLKELAKEQPARNVFISPYSISTVLQMVENGAAGNTRDEMARVLGTSDMETGTFNQAHKDLDASARSAQADVSLTIANAIWYSVGIEVKPVFAALNKDFYGATMDALDFTDPRTGGIVNAWVEKNTSGKIKNIVAGPFPGDTRMVLANAIYFNGKWQRAFDAKVTKPRAFHSSENRESQVPMMGQDGEFEYQEGNGCQAVRLPYKGRRLGMYVLLPEAGSSVAKLLGALNSQVWQQQLLRQMASRKGTIVLPRFKLEYGAELKLPLQTMGMRLPFSNNADFSGMSSSPSYLSEVKHKSFVEVNEEGTEAAAATIAVMRALSVRPETKPFAMVVDRPFLFVIADQVTKAILFLGIVFDPAIAS